MSKPSTFRRDSIASLSLDESSARNESRIFKCSKCVENACQWHWQLIIKKDRALVSAGNDDVDEELSPSTCNRLCSDNAFPSAMALTIDLDRGTNDGRRTHEHTKH